MNKLKARIKLKELQIREKEIDLKLRQTPKPEKRMIRVFSYPTQSGLCAIDLSEGYTKKDYLAAFKIFKECLAMCRISHELTMEEKKEILGLN